MKAGVEKALTGIRATFAGKAIQVVESPCGGAHVLIESVDLGAPFAQSDTWLGFFLNNACPDADLYPLYVRGDLVRADGAKLEPPLHVNQSWPPTNVAGIPVRNAVMVSRRQKNSASIGRETPVIKLLTILKWMKSQ